MQAVSRTVTFEPRRRHELAPGAPRILLAHEGLPERRALRDALEAAGYAVIEAADGTHDAALTTGIPYARSAGVEHNVINDNPHEFVFVEVELK